MPISMTCSNCNKTLKVPDDLAGKKVRCPACKTVLAVPVPEEDVEAIEEEAPPPKKPSNAIKPEKALPPNRRNDDDDDEEERDDEEEDDRPRRKKKRRDDDDDDEDLDVRRKGKSSRSYALGRTAGPGICLMVCGGLGTLLFIVATILNFLGMAMMPELGRAQAAAGQNVAAYNVGQILGSVFMITLNAAVGYGGYQIMTLSNYRSAMSVAIIAMIPICSPCYILGIPFGIWALVVLLDPRVKKAFRS
jgi:phage FluMu protein Com